MSVKKTELDEMRMQRDNLLMLLRRLIVAVKRDPFKPTNTVTDIVEKAEKYMEKNCPPPLIIRTQEKEQS